MKRFMSLMVLCAGISFMALPGCGGSGTNSTVGGTSDAEKQKMADYEAAIKAEEDAMKGNASK